MRERGAKAILAKVPAGYGMTEAEALSYADAVLDALLEPTEGMCLSTGDGPNSSRRVFTSMVRAAKEGK